MSDNPTRRATPLDPRTASVSVVMPVRNEAGYVSTAVLSILSQTFDPARTEIIAVDGMSEDRTVSILAEALGGRPNARVLSNPARTTTSGLNLAIRGTTADVVLRVDGHCRLEPDYIERCVELLAETSAGNAGGLMRPRGTTAIGQAMALALCSRFGIGDSRFHYLERQEFVDSVYLGAFRRDVLLEVGLFDESLRANEDFELNHRIREAGYGVLLSPTIRSSYVPRESVTSIGAQFYRYGRHKARVMRKHPESIQLRHLVPPVAVMTLLAAVLTRLVFRRKSLLPVWIYGGAVAFATLVTARPKRLAPALMLVFPAIHLSWGTGVLVGLLRMRGQLRDSADDRDSETGSGNRADPWACSTRTYPPSPQGRAR
ncbi:MAG TPA: glycosyltransferase family 2 protein [Chloroflexota bacterium]|jgi:glycosyltransferase involved in cell wall biosynthesis|nr:glycosyltransferase family 2 protein [Chloroflexota bacterium]